MLQLASIMINAVDARSLAAFWTAYLDTTAEHQHEGFIWLKRCDGGTLLAFQQVAAATEGRRRLHLDFGSDDVEGDLERALALGASRVGDHWSGSFHWFD